jgi:hypothetical protein
MACCAHQEQVGMYLFKYGWSCGKLKWKNNKTTLIILDPDCQQQHGFSFNHIVSNDNVGLNQFKTGLYQNLAQTIVV